MVDALLTQRDGYQRIVDGGGDYLLPVKENRSALLRDLEDAFPPLETERSAGPKVAAWQAWE